MRLHPARRTFWRGSQSASPLLCSRSCCARSCLNQPLPLLRSANGSTQPCHCSCVGTRHSSIEADVVGHDQLLAHLCPSMAELIHVSCSDTCVQDLSNQHCVRTSRVDSFCKLWLLAEVLSDIVIPCSVRLCQKGCQSGRSARV